MTPYARRMSAAAAVALGITAAGYVTHPHDAIAARTPAQIAPGGNISSVARETAVHGWPHEPTEPEVRDVTDLALWYARVLANRGERVAVLCRFGATMARATCGVEYRAGRHRTAIRLDARVWEDGSYRYRRAGR